VTEELLVRWLRRAAASIAAERERLTSLDAAIGDGDHGINLDRGFGELIRRLDTGACPDDPPAAVLESAGRALIGTVGGASGALYGRGFQRAGSALADVSAAAADASAAAGPAAGPAADGAGSRGPGPNDARLAGDTRLGGDARLAGDTRLAGDARLAGGASRRAVAGSPIAAASRTSRERLAIVAFTAAVDAIAALGRAQVGEKTMLDALVPARRAFGAAVAAGASLADAATRAAEAAEAGAEATIPLLATKGRASYLGERSIGHLDPGAASSALLIRALAEAASEA
jgi:phosphoenolpyruvate---glycerone phosphotransferase subunit DhaL